MLPASEARILAELPAGARVLDVGGGANPFRRADWVIDLLAFSDRGLYGAPRDPEHERFSAATWVQRDICAREPWPFADDAFDFVVCSHTLEDVRDPIAVCDEIVRVGRAGYIEVPSRREEQTWGIQGPWVGWGHHRWLVDDRDGTLEFVYKHHVVNRPGDHLPAGSLDDVAAEARVVRMWWREGFGYRERVLMDGPTADAYLREPIAAAGLEGDPSAGRTGSGGRRRRFSRSRS